MSYKSHLHFANCKPYGYYTCTCVPIIYMYTCSAAVTNFFEVMDHKYLEKVIIHCSYHMYMCVSLCLQCTSATRIQAIIPPGKHIFCETNYCSSKIWHTRLVLSIMYHRARNVLCIMKLFLLVKRQPFFYLQYCKRKKIQRLGPI